MSSRTNNFLMKKYIFLIIGIILLLGLARPYFGFRPSSGDYSTGYNIGVATSYIFGIILLVAYFKEREKSRKISK